MSPTLLNSCAHAATAAEARFRIDRPIPGRAARVVALDAGAAEAVRSVADGPWRATHFLICEERDASSGGGGGFSVRGLDGSERRLSDELADADVVIVIATWEARSEEAAAIARACAERGLMTAGLILGRERDTGAAVSALRPYAPVLLVSDEDDDLAELLTALRA